MGGYFVVWIALIHHKTYTKFVQDLFQAKKFKFGANMASYFNGDYGENQNFIARLKSSLMWLILIQAYIYKPCKPHSGPRKKGECAPTARGKVQNLSKKVRDLKRCCKHFQIKASTWLSSLPLPEAKATTNAS